METIKLACSLQQTDSICSLVPAWLLRMSNFRKLVTLLLSQKSVSWNRHLMRCQWAAGVWQWAGSYGLYSQEGTMTFYHCSSALWNPQISWTKLHCEAKVVCLLVIHTFIFLGDMVSRTQPSIQLSMEPHLALNSWSCCLCSQLHIFILKEILFVCILLFFETVLLCIAVLALLELSL